MLLKKLLEVEKIVRRKILDGLTYKKWKQMF